MTLYQLLMICTEPKDTGISLTNAMKYAARRKIERERERKIKSGDVWDLENVWGNDGG
jgi:hypothetical protein